MHSTQRTCQEDLADQCIANLGPAAQKASVDIGGDGERRVVEGYGLEGLGEFVLCRLHQLAVEGCADGKHDGAFGSSLFA